MKKFSLDDHPKIKPGFSAPQGYFDTLPDRVMERLDAETPVIHLQKKTSWLWAAASVLALALAIPMLNRLSEPSEKPIAADHAAIENYLVTNSNLSSYDLGEMLDSEELNALNSVALEQDVIEEALYYSDVEHYLID